MRIMLARIAGDRKSPLLDASMNPEVQGAAISQSPGKPCQPAPRLLRNRFVVAVRAVVFRFFPAAILHRKIGDEVAQVSGR